MNSNENRIHGVFTGLILALMLATLPAAAQIDAPNIFLRRGMLWNSYNYAKTGAPFTNWTRVNYGLDWPGFDPEWINASLGGSPSYLTTGGMWFAAPSPYDSAKIWIEDWAMYGSSVGPTGQTRYRVTKHTKRWPQGENYWLQADPREAEEVIESEWIPNPTYVPQYPGDEPMPLRVTRTVRQWAGAQRHENFIIVQYVIRNTSDTMTLRGAYSMLMYGIAGNARAWRTLFPGLNAGARNNRFNYEPTGVRARMMYGYADNTPLTTRFVKYGLDSLGGPTGYGEYLAPGWAGFKLLYATPDTVYRTPTYPPPDRRSIRTVWAAAPDQQDLYGPFGTASAGTQLRYQIIKDPTQAAESFTSPFDSRMTQRRIWSLMSLGPWTIRPGDSVVIAVGEFVGGISYNSAVDSAYVRDASRIGSETPVILRNMSSAMQQAYDNQFNVPDPPAAPRYTVKMNPDPTKINNIIEWTDEAEAILDPDYPPGDTAAADLAGYRVYRSSYLPIGPWKLIADIKKGDVNFKAGTLYSYEDVDAVLGIPYYYAVTAYDNGHPNWPPRTTNIFIETGSNRVPPLESSIYASMYAHSSLDPNYVVRPFRTTQPPRDKLDKNAVFVSPNPFVLKSGSGTPDDKARVQFFNMPSPCTIRIYTIRGDLVRTIHHTQPDGIVTWNFQTDYGQFIVSGIYVYHIETPEGESITGKIGIVR